MKLFLPFKVKLLFTLGLQPAITSEPPNPSTVVEGQNLTLQWIYNLAGQSILNIRILNVTDETLTPPPKVAEKRLDADAIVQPGYENRFRANLSDTQATLTILAVPRSFNEEQFRLLIIIDDTLQSKDVEISVLGKSTILVSLVRLLSHLTGLSRSTGGQEFPLAAMSTIARYFCHRWPKRNMRVCMGSNEFET